MNRLRAKAGTVRVRTIIAAVVIVGVSLAIGAVVLVGLMRRTLVQGVRDSAVVRATEVADVLKSGTSPGALGLPDVEDTVIQVLDTEGSVVASSPNVVGKAPVARLRPGQSTQRNLTAVDGDLFLIVARGAENSGGRYTVLAARSLDSVIESTTVVSRLLGFGLPVLLLIVGATTWRLAGRALAPVEAIRREVDAISARELHRRVPLPTSTDEISRLAITMNQMLDRLEDAQTRHRRFITDASHELRSPVASIRQHAEVARAHPGSSTVGELAETVLAENMRVQRLVDDLLILARADEHTLELRQRPVDLDDLVFDEGRRLREITKLKIDTTAVSARRVKGDLASLRRVLRNIADNAAFHARGRVAFSLGGPDGAVVLSIDDDGAGIPEAERARVFERFVRLDDARTRDAGGGGLGLAIVAELVAAHGGKIAVVDSPLGGARFEIRWQGLANPGD